MSWGIGSVKSRGVAGTVEFSAAVLRLGDVWCHSVMLRRGVVTSGAVASLSRHSYVKWGGGNVERGIVWSTVSLGRVAFRTRYGAVE